MAGGHSDAPNDSKPLSPEDRMLQKPTPTDDCLPCRLTGAVAICGLAGYVFVKAQQQIIADRKLYAPWEFKLRRFGVAGISMLLFSIGASRVLH